MNKIGASTTLSTNGERPSTSLGTSPEFIEGRSRTIGILSLGCPRNIVDSEGILGRLREKGYSIVDLSDADVAILNTCAFIKEAKTESIDAILDLVDLKKQGRLKRIIVYGCLVSRYQDTLRKEFPEVDAFVGTLSLNHAKNRLAITPKHYAYLKVCEGCIHHCSFCVIPKIKGRFSSLDIKSVVERAKIFDQEKISELNIIGQDTSSYGIDLYGLKKLPELLKRILKATKNIPWMRLLYLHPDLKLIDELLEIMKDEPRITRYIDLPIQHINNRILKLMNRNTPKDDILRLIDKIRQKLPRVAIRTSLIVGFPSEQEREFKELLEFVEAVKFERLGVFMYSREETTPASDFKAQIPATIKKARFNAIMSRQQEISQELNKKMLGKIIDVLIDEIDENEKTCYLGRSQFDAPEVDGLVFVQAKKVLRPGDFVQAKVRDTLEYDLVAEVEEV